MAIELSLALLTLAAGPILYRLLSNNRQWDELLAGAVVSTICGLILLLVLPDLIDQGGYVSLAFMVAGFIGPTLVEKAFHRAAEGMHFIALGLGLLGLLMHTFMDGAALIDHNHPQNIALPLAIILHRLPVGLTVWWLLRPAFGLGLAVVTLVLMAGATVLGFYFGADMNANFSTNGLIWFQALVSGSIMHVVVHRPHHHDHTTDTTTHEPLPDDHGHSHSHVHSHVQSSWLPTRPKLIGLALGTISVAALFFIDVH